MLPVKHTVIYTFFAITSVQNTCFCSVFNALASKNPAKSCYVQCFFHFWPFFHCRKATKMTQNSISIPSCAQTPKNPRKMSKTPPYSGLGAKPFLGPPPAKADIATAILTNVIEHLVLLLPPLPPNKHAFTAKADISMSNCCGFQSLTKCDKWTYPWIAFLCGHKYHTADFNLAVSVPNGLLPHAHKGCDDTGKPTPCLPLLSRLSPVIHHLNTGFLCLHDFGFRINHCHLQYAHCGVMVDPHVG